MAINQANSILEFNFPALEVFGNEPPVDQTIEVLKVSGSGVAVVDVVGVFPDVDGEEGSVVVGERVAGVGGVEDGDVFVVLGEPGPARAEVGHSLGREVLEELLNAAPLVHDEFSEFSLGLSLFRSDAMPVEGVVPVLGGVVEDFGVLAAEWGERYVATISSRLLCSQSVPLTSELRLLM